MENILKIIMLIVCIVMITKLLNKENYSKELFIFIAFSIIFVMYTHNQYKTNFKKEIKNEIKEELSRKNITNEENNKQNFLTELQSKYDELINLYNNTDNKEIKEYLKEEINKIVGIYNKYIATHIEELWQHIKDFNIKFELPNIK